MLKVELLPSEQLCSRTDLAKEGRKESSVHTVPTVATQSKHSHTSPQDFKPIRNKPKHSALKKGANRAIEVQTDIQSVLEYHTYLYNYLCSHQHLLLIVQSSVEATAQ